jgi:DNA-directed RNA polymerase
MNAAAPNFIHSLDAAHAARVINAANVEGITNVATIHDCYASLAPTLQRVHQLVKREFFILHDSDPLTALWDAIWHELWHGGSLCNERAAAAIALYLMRPQRGSLDLAEVQRSEFMTS